VRFGRISSASNSRRNSLTVNGIRPLGAGFAVRSAAAATVRNAARAWPGWSTDARTSTVEPGAGQDRSGLAGLEALLDPPALTGDRDQRGQRHPPRMERTVVGDLAGGVVAAQQHPVPPRLGGCDPDPGPGVQVWSVGSRSGGQPLPALRTDPGSQLLDLHRFCAGGDPRLLATASTYPKPLSSDIDRRVGSAP